MEMKIDTSTPFGWMTMWDPVESHYQADNCSTRNEFIEKAIRFYPAIWTRNLPMLTCPGSWPTCWMASWEPWANG